ncbi:hypothetical protein QTP88_019028 [Uroleucon formosanum]
MVDALMRPLINLSQCLVDIMIVVQYNIRFSPIYRKTKTLELQKLRLLWHIQHFLVHILAPHKTMVRAAIFIAYDALASTGPAAACGIYKPSGRSLLIYRRLIPDTSAWREPVRASFGSRRPSPDRRVCSAFASSSSAVTAMAVAAVEAAAEVMAEARRDAKWREAAEIRRELFVKTLRRRMRTAHVKRQRRRWPPASTRPAVERSGAAAP